MNTALMFSSKSDEWSTPQDFWLELHREFHFEVDAAATADNAKCLCYFGLDAPHPLRSDGLAANWKLWALGQAVWCNPPYSRGLQKQFIVKAAAERLNGVTTVMLIPARTDTRAFHEHIWDAERQKPREGIEVRFLPGRLKFGGAKDSAPFPSMLVIFRGGTAERGGVSDERVSVTN